MTKETSLDVGALPVSLDELCAARHAIIRLGWTWHGGQEWKPPIGTKPLWLLPLSKRLAVALGVLRGKVSHVR